MSNLVNVLGGSSVTSSQICRFPPKSSNFHLESGGDVLASWTSWICITIVDVIICLGKGVLMPNKMACFIAMHEECSSKVIDNLIGSMIAFE